MSQPELETKSFGAFEIKNADAGEVTAIVATLGVVDKDGDVLLPGSFPESASVKLSAYGHDTILDGAPHVGRGAITTRGDKVVLDAKFFLSMTRGREAFSLVKEDPQLEWSFGFPRAVKTAQMTDEWKAKGARRLITGIQPIEASPVFIGAGVGTQTVAAKAALVDEVLASGNPYDLVKRGDEFCVLKKESREVVKCHSTHAEALAQFQALEIAYHNEKAAQDEAQAKEALLNATLELRRRRTRAQ